MKKEKIFKIEGYVLMPDNFNGTFVDVLRYIIKLDKKTHKSRTQKTSLRNETDLWERFNMNIKKGLKVCLSYGLFNYISKNNQWKIKEISLSEK